MAIDRARLRRLFEEAQGPLGVKEILRAAGLHPGHQTELKRVLRDMLRAGEVEKTGKRFHALGTKGRGKAKLPKPGAAPHREGRGRAAPARAPQERGAPRRQRGERHAADEGPLVEGVLHVHPDGYGFVHPFDEEGENIFLPPDQAQRALDQDRVVVRVVAGRDGRSAGELVRVSDRRRQMVVGIYTSQGDRAVVMPKDASLPGPIRVPPTQIARDGDVVKVRLGVGAGLLGGARGLVGEVAGSLGGPGTPGAEVLNIAFAAGFSDEFPPEVMDEADAYEPRVTEDELQEPGRRDLRELPLVTIDGEDARDFDDAIHVERRGHDWRLVVAIADVSAYVREGMALDAEALRRATSVYLPDRVLPMLPERLSNGICSLKPDEDRLCMVADMVLDHAGALRSYELYPGVMRSAARCTYNEVQAVLDGKDVPHRNRFKPDFERMEELARTLRRMREKRGAIDFDIPEVRVLVGPDGAPERMVQRDRLFAHRIVEECMLAANEAVAKFFQDNELPSVYRFHGDPDEEKLAAFAALANVHGFELDPASVTSYELNQFVKELEGHPEQLALNQLLLRSMMQAVYSAQNVGHYGLAAEHYLHFTSPIRRYPDLLVHRQLKRVWARKGKKYSEAEREREEERLEAMAVQSSERERAAMKVEREVVSFYATLLMKDRVGEEFEASVVGVTDFGFFVKLKKELVEGLVKAESLGPGAHYEQSAHALVFLGGRKVRVGQRLTARLIGANLDRRQLEFDVVAFEGEEALDSAQSLDDALHRFRLGASGGKRPAFKPRGRAGRHEERERPAFVPPVSRRPPEPEPSHRRPVSRPEPEERPPHRDAHEEAPSSSPHPGFDRLRALAAKKGGVAGGGRFAQGAPKTHGKHGGRTERGPGAERGEPGAGRGGGRSSKGHGRDAPSGKGGWGKGKPGGGGKGGGKARGGGGGGGGGGRRR